MNPSRSTAPIAPPWHTVLLVIIFLWFAIGGALFQRHSPVQPKTPHQHRSLAPMYLGLIATEWGLFLYVWMGLRRRGVTVRDVVAGRWSSAKDVAIDTGLALGLLVVWMLIARSWPYLFREGHNHAASARQLLPRTPLEMTLWIVLSLSAGISEEFIFRGYFLRQFQAFTRSPWIALALQGALFGISHGYQGIQACAMIAVYAVLFGVMAIWRRSLRPGMICHAATDILAGIFGI